MLVSTPSLVALLGLTSAALARRTHRSTEQTKATQATQTLDITFADYSGSSGSAARSWLEEQGLTVSDWSIDDGDAPYSHVFVPENVDIVDGSLRLKVSAQLQDGLIPSGEVATQAENIRYGTFKTVAKAPTAAGTCTGFFTYTDDNHELDIELLSSYYTTGYQYSVKPGLEFTAQPLVEGEDETNEVVSYGFDPSADFHEYTLTWTANSAKFYVDGELKTTLTDNIPQIGAQFMYNIWSNGDPNWSAGPPTEDAYAYIQSISLEYTTA
ncbi:hypothetical protein JCM10207_009009 [Rhodosporidiobolus poonsookiae]